MSSEKEGKIKGSVDTLYKVAKAEASIEARLKQEIKNLQQGTASVSEKYAIAARTMYLFCGMVANAKDISTERKWQLFQALQSTIGDQPRTGDGQPATKASESKSVPPKSGQSTAGERSLPRRSLTIQSLGRRIIPLAQLESHQEDVVGYSRDDSWFFYHTKFLRPSAHMVLAYKEGFERGIDELQGGRQIRLNDISNLPEGANKAVSRAIFFDPNLLLLDIRSPGVPGEVVAIDRMSLQPMWRIPHEGKQWIHVHLAGSTLAIAESGNEDRIRLFSMKTSPPERLPVIESAYVVCANDTKIVFFSKGAVISMDGGTGRRDEIGRAASAGEIKRQHELCAQESTTTTPVDKTTQDWIAHNLALRDNRIVRRSRDDSVFGEAERASRFHPLVKAEFKVATYDEPIVGILDRATREILWQGPARTVRFNKDGFVTEGYSRNGHIELEWHKVVGRD